MSEEDFQEAVTAFVERLESPHYTLSWGSDGAGPTSTVWEVDYTGSSQPLELDDRETTLLCTWVRTGAWLHPQVLRELSVAVAPAGGAAELRELEAALGESVGRASARGAGLGLPGAGGMSPFLGWPSSDTALTRVAPSRAVRARGAGWRPRLC